MTKKELRKLYKEKRQSISDRDRMKMDDLLLIQFQKMFLEQVEVLFT
jgi:5-formyltetrahydrofolate cyclo-ligase